MNHSIDITTTNTKETKGESLCLEEQKQLFEKYKAVESEIHLFYRLKTKCEELKLPVNNPEILVTVIVKKTYENSLHTLKAVSTAIEEFQFGRKKLDEKHLKFLKYGYFHIDNRIRGLKNGEFVMICEISRFKKSIGEVVEDYDFCSEAHLIYCYRFLISNPDASKNGVIVVIDMRGLNMKLVFNKKLFKLSMTNFKDKIGKLKNTGVPFKLSKLVFLYPPWYCRFALNIGKKLLMKDKLCKRIVVTHKPSEVLKFVSGLPKFMGGDLKNLESLSIINNLKSVISFTLEDEILFDKVLLQEKKVNTSEQEEQEEQKEQEIEGESDQD